MKVSVACDHGAVELKNSAVSYLQSKGIEVIDCGTYNTERCDYPDFAVKACKLLTVGEVTYAMLFCTTGIGMSICANKVSGVRCALCRDSDEAEFSRRHNNANALAMGAKYVSKSDAEKIIDSFLHSQFEGGRHSQRVEKIGLIEKGEL